MGYYKHERDKKSGDGLALSEWNSLSNAVAGNSGLTLASGKNDKVGIGIVNINNENPPEAKLEVNGGAVRAGFSSKNNYTEIGHGGMHGYVNKVGEGNLDFRLGGSTEMCINPDGQVGIGTVSPDAKLHVNGNIQATKFIGDGSELKNLNVEIKSSSSTIFSTKGSEKSIVQLAELDNLLADQGILFNAYAVRKQPSSTGILPDSNTSTKYNSFFGEKLETYAGTILFSSNTGSMRFMISKESEGKGTNVTWGKVGMLIDKGGNVGIGTTTELSRSLTIQGSDTNHELLGFRNSGGEDKYHWNLASGGLNLAETGEEDYRLFIKDGGNVGIGTSTPGAKLDVNGTLRLTSPDGTNHSRLYTKNEGTGTGFYIQLHKTHEGVINNNTWIRFDGGGGDMWDVPSDKRLKTDIVQEGNILGRLLQLEVKNYHWKNRKKRPHKSIGFIAQDVQPLFPSLVSEAEDPETKESTLTLKYASFGVLAVGAIKELKEEKDKEIVALQARLAALEAAKNGSFVQ